MDTPFPHGNFEGDVCPVVASPPTKADRCPVTLGPSAVSSIDAEMTSWVCNWVTDNPMELSVSLGKRVQLCKALQEGQHVWP
jgi:hypothetical protein